MKLYEKLSALRKSHNYTQEQLANKLGVTRQTVSKWEMGISEPSLDLLDKIADIYGCTVDELMCRNIKDDDMSVEPAAPLSESDRTHERKAPFWSIYKEAAFVFIVGIIVMLAYCLYTYFSVGVLSITVFMAIEGVIFIVSTIITIAGDERIKTKSGILGLVLPLVVVIVIQIVLGIIVEC